MTRIAYASIVALLCMSSMSSAQIVFMDNFDTENGGNGTFNYTSFAKWTVSDGSVDLLGNGFFTFYPSNGLYVELDGTTGDAAKMTSLAIAVTPGTYLLQFDLGINSGLNSMIVSLGTDYTETFDETDAGPWGSMNSISRQFQVTTTGNVQLIFDHLGGDTFGLMIDNVSLTGVPEPTSFVLLGLSSLGFLLRRRR